MAQFYRVESVKTSEDARKISGEWGGIILIPLVDPSSPGGQWLSSTDGREILDSKTGSSILIIYPDQRAQFSYKQFLECLCESFEEHDHSFRIAYPSSSIIIIENESKKCTIFRMRSALQSESATSSADDVRRSMTHVINTILRGPGLTSILKIESAFFEFYLSIENAAPILSSALKKLQNEKTVDLIGRIFGLK